MSDLDFHYTFSHFTSAYYSEDKMTSYYEVLDSFIEHKPESFVIENPLEQEVYIGVSFYNPRMYPKGCARSLKTTGLFTFT